MATKKSDLKFQAPALGPDWIAFAQVGRPHGLKGAFFLKTSDRRTAWDGYQNLILQTREGEKPIQVTKAYISGGAVAVVTNLFATREQVEEVYDAALLVHRSEIQTQADEYVVSDLLGLKVFASGAAEGGKELGEVVAVVNFGAQENLEIKLTGTNRTIYFPFIEAFVTKIDSVNRTLEIVYAPEFFDEGKVSEGDKS